MGLMLECRLLEHLRVLLQSRDEGLLMGRLEERQAGLPDFRVPDLTAGPQLLHHAAHPGAGVLHVVHRIVVGLGLGELEVEIHVLLASTHHIVETRGIGTDLVDELAQRDKLTRPGRHRQPLIPAVENGELDQENIQGSITTPDPQTLEGPADPGYIAMVIGPPNIDNAGEPAIELIQMIGDIRGEIRGLAILTAYDTILGIAERRGSKPQGPIGLIETTRGLEPTDGGLDRAGFDQLAFRIPAVIGNPKVPQILGDAFEDGIQRPLDEPLESLLPEQSSRSGNGLIHIDLLIASLGCVRR